MIKLPDILQAWGTPAFPQAFAASIQQLDASALPLQQALAHSSHVSDSPRTIIILDTAETPAQLQIRAGIFYAGIIAGSCCSDDPTPLCEENEYCEIQLNIDRRSAETRISLL